MNLRVVFDCNVFLQGIASSKGPAALCFRYLEENAFELMVSEDILGELSDVLSRPEIRTQFKSISDARVEEFLSLVKQHSKLVDSVPSLFDFPRDHDDEPYLNLAIHVAADYLVTRDHDLLDLGRDDIPESVSFKQRFPHLTILTPNEFTTILWEREMTVDE